MCSRNCRFCAVRNGNPGAPDEDEPERVARAVQEMGLSYVVLTSVTREDLEDGGADHFAETVKAIRERNREVFVEALVPDFGGDEEALALFLASMPDVLNHNVETVRRLTPFVRDPRADYDRSLWILRRSKEINPGLLTKSGIIVGLGETRAEIGETMGDLRDVGCDLLTVGQYLQPTRSHAPVDRYVTPEEFREIEEEGLEWGFLGVASGPMVRSSYRAAHYYRSARLKQGRSF